MGPAALGKFYLSHASSRQMTATGEFRFNKILLIMSSFWNALTLNPYHGIYAISLRFPLQKSCILQ